MMGVGVCCGTCRHHRFSKGYDDWECLNDQSPDYLEFTAYDDGYLCKFHEPRQERHLRFSEYVERTIRTTFND